MQWDPNELAMLMNCTDACIENEQEYRSYAREKLRRLSGRIRSDTSIDHKLRRFLLSYNQTIQLAELLKFGTKSLNFENIPDEIKNHMEAQRADLNLEPLMNVSSPGSNSSAVIGNEDAQNEDNVELRAMQERNAVPESERDPNVIDPLYHSSGSGINTMQVKQGTIQTRPTQPSDIVQAAISGEHHREIAKSIEVGSQGQTGLQGERTKSYNADKASPPLNVVSSPKRKASESEAFNTESNSAPPSKRHRSDKTLKSINNLSGPPESAHNLQSRESTEDMPRRPWHHLSKTTSSRVDTSSSASHAVPSSSSLQPSDATDMMKMEDLAYLVCSLLREQMVDGKALAPDVRKRLGRVELIMKQMPGNLATQLLDNWKAADDSKVALLKQFRALVGHQEFGMTKFPSAPPAREIDQDWIAFRQGFKEAFTDEIDRLVQGERLRQHTAGYIAGTIDHLMEYPQVREDCSARLGIHLNSPHAAQSLLSCILCCSVFEAPDPMFDGEHSRLMMKQYESTIINDGPSEIQRIEKIAFSNLFADNNFQESNFQNMQDKLLRNVSRYMEVYPSALGLEGMRRPKTWAEGALRLKQKLTISPRDYRIHFCPPHTVFDPEYMTAEDVHGIPLSASSAKDKEIAICLFPALVEQEPKSLEGADISACLLKNKNFFPTWQEKQAFDPKNVISKAVVLVM